MSAELLALSAYPASKVLVPLVFVRIPLSAPVPTYNASPGLISSSLTWIVSITAGAPIAVTLLEAIAGLFVKKLLVAETRIALACTAVAPSASSA